MALDLTDYLLQRRLHTTQEVLALVSRMKEEVRRATGGLSCSAGVASNQMLAKISSDLNKPDGVHHLPSCPALIRQSMASLPLRKIPGVGTQAETLFNRLGVFSCGDVLAKQALLRTSLPYHHYLSVLRKSLGLYSNQHSPREDRKSFNQSETIRPPTLDPLVLQALFGQ